MSFQLLIDGYNLLFTAGFEGNSRARGWLKRARQRLLTHLELHLIAAERARTLVVFDVSVDVLKTKERELEDVQGVKVEASGIQVAFAFGYDEADDMLESLIRKHSTPKKLTVVSSDNRIRKCAVARRASSVDSEAFLRRLELPSRDVDATAEMESDRGERTLTELEVQDWLREFGREAGS